MINLLLIYLHPLLKISYKKTIKENLTLKTLLMLTIMKEIGKTKVERKVKIITRKS